MAMRAAISKAASAAVAPRGFRALLFSTERTSPLFTPPQPPAQNQTPPPAEPSNNLFVSGLSKRTTTEGLRTAFEKFGKVTDAKVVTDRTSGYSKGFGFVKYETLEEAAAGIKGMDGQFLDGWVIFAEYARPRSPPPPPQNSFGNGYSNTSFQGRRPY
ncbi:OLC1v1023020C1 [Oldenlandia corymbosa var. corymbosa]|uniref:OLC1v1023020C1 n=1 Tax=Oldenlandia corymbosa var. corymbosa TaxID=529605 RepID=A0AAV1C1I4_OLDCO|nr:OLC1v1023020C1 [Oldenlandia corymbosa var. corymbosa]